MDPQKGGQPYFGVRHTNISLLADINRLILVIIPGLLSLGRGGEIQYLHEGGISYNSTKPCIPKDTNRAQFDGIVDVAYSPAFDRFDDTINALNGLRCNLSQNLGCVLVSKHVGLDAKYKCLCNSHDDDNTWNNRENPEAVYSTERERCEIKARGRCTGFSGKIHSAFMYNGEKSPNILDCVANAYCDTEFGKKRGPNGDNPFYNRCRCKLPYFSNDEGFCVLREKGGDQSWLAAYFLTMLACLITGQFWLNSE